MAVSSIGNLQPSTVHVDQILSNLAMEWTYPELIGELLAPITPVQKKTDQYPIFYGDDMERLVQDARGPGGDFNQVEWSFSKDSYNTEGHGLENTTPWETLANADSWAQDYLNGAAIGSMLKHMVMLNHELKVSTILNTSGNYASGYYEDMDTVAGRNFDDGGTTNGLKILQQFIRLIRRKSLGAPVWGVITGDCWIEMQSDTNFKAVFTDRLLADPDLIRTQLKLDRLIVVDAQYNAADKGQAASRTDFWTSNSIWLLTVAPAGSGSRVPGTVKTFQWSSPDLAGRGEGVRVGMNERQMYRWIQYLKYYDVKATGVNSSDLIESGCWLKNVYASL